MAGMATAMIGRLAGRRIVITGAGRGLGFAYAERLGREGASIIIAEIDAEFSPHAGGIGDWRRKDSAFAIDFLGPQMYRMLTGDGWEYTVSGMSPDRAPKAFRFFLRNDEELRHIERRDAIEQYRARARARWARVLD
jgi:hypothetical protein